MPQKNRKKGACAYDVVSYSLPTYHEGKTCYVDFVCFDPVSETMRRKKYHLDGIPRKADRRRRATELIALLTAKLRTGWNVWADAAATDGKRIYTPIAEVCELWGRSLERMGRTGVLRPASVDRKRSYAKVFFGWLAEEGRHRVSYAYQLTREVLNDFLDYMLLDREVSTITRNNYRTWLVGFCDFMVDKRFAAENAAAGLKVLTEAEKQREALSTAQLSRLRAHLERTGDGWMLLACMMEYYCFIRPSELSSVRIGDICVKAQSVRLSREFTKNRRDGRVGLNEEVLRRMLELGVFDYPSDYYLFGGKDLRPGPEKQEGRIFRDHWLKVRKALGWGSCYQFYSLKDTGIRDLANAEGIVVARDQARHTDVSTTNKYLKGDALRVHEETKHFKGGL